MLEIIIALAAAIFLGNTLAHRIRVTPAILLIFLGLALALLPAMHEAGADVIGVDYRLPLDEANRRLNGAVPLQGNIDPALLAAGRETLYAHVDEVLAAGASAPAHIVNLGHGVPPTTDPQVLTDLVTYLHERTRRP